jgi:hypothetical protein
LILEIFMHYKRKKARTRSRSAGVFPNGTPAHWNILFHNRPRRRRDTMALMRVRRGADPDALVWDLGNSRPHTYYW